MASINGVSPLNNNILFSRAYAPRGYLFHAFQNLKVGALSQFSSIVYSQEQSLVMLRSSKFRGFKMFSSMELDQFVTSDDEDEMGEGFFEAIEELERMARDPSDVLEEMGEGFFEAIGELERMARDPSDVLEERRLKDV